MGRRRTRADDLIEAASADLRRIESAISDISRLVSTIWAELQPDAVARSLGSQASRRAESVIARVRTSLSTWLPPRRRSGRYSSNSAQD